MALPLRCAASLRLAGTGSSSFGVSDPGHRPVEIKEAHIGKSQTCRASEWQSHWVGSRPLNLAVHKCKCWLRKSSPLSVKQETATDGVKPWILRFSILDASYLKTKLDRILTANDFTARIALSKA